MAVKKSSNPNVTAQKSTVSALGIPVISAEAAKSARASRKISLQQLSELESPPVESKSDKPPAKAAKSVPAKEKPVPEAKTAEKSGSAGVAPQTKEGRDKTAKEREKKGKERRSKAATPGPGVMKRPVILHLTSKEKILFTRHLSVMLDAGIPLQEVLAIYMEQTKSPTLKYILHSAIADLSNGESLAAILAKFPKQFEPFFVHIVKVGEETGTLPASLKYIEAQMHKSQELKSKVRAALLYPLIVFCGAIGIACYLAFYLLPRLVPIFISLGAELPPTTKLLLNVSSWMSKNWVLFIVLLAILVVALSMVARIRPVRYALHALFLATPVLGQLVREIQITQFARILGTLHMSGVHILDALTITSQSLGNLVFQRRVNEITSLVERGETLGEQLKKHPKLFNRTCSSMVMIGERTGKLSESLITLSEFSEREVDGYTKNLSALIEPLTLLFLGGIVGFVAFSIISPIYQLTQGLTR